MPTSSDNQKFWVLVTTAILAVSVLVLLIDMSIKAAILAESNQLRLVIEGERNDKGRKAGAMDAAPSNGNSAPDVLGADDSGVEKGYVYPSDTVTPIPLRRKPKPGPRGQSSGDIPPAN